MSLFKTVATIYVVSKVAPVIIKGVVYITEGAMQGITDKVVRDLDKLVFGEDKDRRRNLRRERKHYRSYSEYRSQ